jgi:molybdate transport system substrate-binding protein
VVGGLVACGTFARVTAGRAADRQATAERRPAATAGSAPAAVIVTVFAAASLTEAIGELARRSAASGRDPLRPVFAASSILARQIEQGAAADVFAAADADWMDYVERRGLLRAGTRRDVLGNRLVLVAPAGSALALAPAPGFAPGAALGRSGRLALGDPDFVPAGRYARAALTSLGAWPQVADRLARAENVRAALALVARGEAPLGIVYATDARAEPRVRVLGEFPAGSHPPIRYPFAITARARGPAVDAAFAFLTSGPEALATYRQSGFEPLAGALRG